MSSVAYSVDDTPQFDASDLDELKKHITINRGVELYYADGETYYRVADVLRIYGHRLPKKRDVCELSRCLKNMMYSKSDIKILTYSKHLYVNMFGILSYFIHEYRPIASTQELDLMEKLLFDISSDGKRYHGIAENSEIVWSINQNFGGNFNEYIQELLTKYKESSARTVTKNGYVYYAAKAFIRTLSSTYSIRITRLHTHVPEPHRVKIGTTIMLTEVGCFMVALKFLMENDPQDLIEVYVSDKSNNSDPETALKLSKENEDKRYYLYHEPNVYYLNGERHIEDEMN